MTAQIMLFNSGDSMEIPLMIPGRLCPVPNHEN